MPDGDAGVRYKALAAGVIRTGAAMDSPKADPEKLTVGQEFVVTETEIVDGTVRLKFDRGCKYLARVRPRADCAALSDALAPRLSPLPL